jgi:HprK-related kinase A
VTTEQLNSGKVSDLSQRSFEDLLKGPGLGLQIGPFNARVRVEVAGLSETLYRFYCDHPLLDTDSVHSFHVCLQHKRAFPRLYRHMVRFTVDGRKPHEDMPIAQAVPVFEWGLNLVVALRSHSFLMLHAAVLERNGKALLLPAMPGHGKTTLCAGLSHRGWRAFSDEFGLIRPGTHEMIPVPRPMALKNDSIDIIRDFAPDAFIGPATPNTRKGTVAHLKPPADSVARQNTKAPVGMIIFPKWVKDASLNLQPISKGESFMLLATNAFNYELLGEAAFRTVSDLVDTAACYRLVYSDLEEATRRLTELADTNAS